MSSDKKIKLITVEMSIWLFVCINIGMIGAAEILVCNKLNTYLPIIVFSVMIQYLIIHNLHCIVLANLKTPKIILVITILILLEVIYIDTKYTISHGYESVITHIGTIITSVYIIKCLVSQIEYIEIMFILTELEDIIKQVNKEDQQ